jgi:hypothetical protein
MKSWSIYGKYSTRPVGVIGSNPVMTAKTLKFFILYLHDIKMFSSFALLNKRSDFF